MLKLCALPAPALLQAALYEKLLGGALQVFYRSTMQGRNQHRLLQIRCGGCRTGEGAKSSVLCRSLVR